MSATFHKGDGPPPIEVAPVLAADHSVRFQIKALREGFRRRPDLASEEKVDAVERLNDFIQAHLTCEGVQLPRGHIVMLNNRRSLHSRKHFTDPQPAFVAHRCDGLMARRMNFRYGVRRGN